MASLVRPDKLITMNNLSSIRPKSLVPVWRVAALMAWFYVIAGGIPAFAQQPAWVVRSQWVQAHENFLASDALAGRGSATRDEEIAAEYVASEFLGYGLKVAPGLIGYVQSADLVAPELDGKATLSGSGGELHEGADLRLLLASGAGSTGPLVRVPAAAARQAALPKSAVILLVDVPAGVNTVALAYGLRGSGASLVLVEEDESVRAYEAKSPRTRTGVRLEDSEEERSLPATIATLSKEAATRLKDGETVTLTVHTLPNKRRRTYSAIGYLQGTDPSAGTILLSAHLDHLGVSSATGAGDTIYNGANDDAAGTTAILELAHALAAGPPLRRNILFVCYGSEELGGLGSQFFGRHSPVSLSQIVTNLEFEMIGAQDPKMPKDTLLLTGWERSNLGPVLREHGARLGPDPYPEQHFFQRSDNYQLALKGVVAHTAAGWRTVPTYHQPNDDLAHIDIGFMTTVIQSFVEPIRWLAGSDFKPAWNPGGQPTR
jgi:aminopeptidase YwaD